MAIVPQNPQMMNNVAAPQKAKKGSGFTNLQSVLSANQGNRLGTAVTGGVQKAGEQALTSLQQGQQQFQAGLGDARQQRQGKEELVKNTLGKFGQAGYTGEDIGEGEAKGFEELRNAKYAGPQTLSNEQQVQQQAGQAQQLGQFAGDRQGRQELLRRFVGGVPQYSQRKQMQDELLLSLGGGEQDLKKAGASTRGLTKKTAEEIQKAKFAAGDESNQLEAAKTNAQSGIEKTLTPIEQQLAQRQAERQKEQAWRQGAVGEIQARLARGDIKGAMQYGQEKGVLQGDQATLLDTLSGYGANSLGGNDVFGSKTSPQELAQLFDFGGIATSRNIADKSTRGRLNALARLSGKQQEFTGEQEMDKATSANKAVAQALAQRQLSEISNPDKEAELNKAAELVRQQQDVYNSTVADKFSGFLRGQTAGASGGGFGGAAQADMDRRQRIEANNSLYPTQKQAELKKIEDQARLRNVQQLSKYGINSEADLNDKKKMAALASRVFSENASGTDKELADQLGASAGTEQFYNMYKDIGELNKFNEQNSMYQNETQDRQNRKLALQRILSGQGV